MRLDAMSSLLFTTFRILGSSIDGPHSGVLVGGKGIGGLDEVDDNLGAETLTNAEAYGAPGIVWRPRVPEVFGGEELSAEAFSVRTGDGAQPLAWRDLRWNRNYPAPKPGTIALVGYGGGFLSFEDTANGLSATTLYVPYDYDEGGTAQKAMTIAIDPEQESIMIVHGDGYAVVMDADNGITNRSKDGKSYTQLKEGAFSVVATTISLQGNVSMGSNTAAAIPLLPGVSSQPTTSVFFSP